MKITYFVVLFITLSSFLACAAPTEPADQADIQNKLERWSVQKGIRWQYAPSLQGSIMLLSFFNNRRTLLSFEQPPKNLHKKETKTSLGVIPSR